MRKAFLLGAGLGTRLKPLTDSLPKPLIPYANRPLITHVMDHCIAAGITDFAINTHHLAEAWHAAFPDGTYRGASLTFFHVARNNTSQAAAAGPSKRTWVSRHTASPPDLRDHISPRFIPPVKATLPSTIRFLR